MRSFFAALGACFLLFWAASVHAEALPKTFYKGVSFYEEGVYEKALDLFLSLYEKEGIQSGALSYNIANTYMQLKETGRAMVWYERARAAMPGDPDLAFNRGVAFSKAKDLQEEKEGLLQRLLFFWKKGISLLVLQKVAIGSGIFFWILGMFVLVRRHSALKALLLFSGLFFAVVSSTALWDTICRRQSDEAVVLAPSVAVRSGLSESSTELFTLHAGSFVRLEAFKGEWVRIAFGPDKRGWVASGAVEKIWP